MALLSVNVNKFALIRNSRENGKPNLLEIVDRCVLYGAQGITLHPRPDERHARFSDLVSISELLKLKKEIELNIEGYPSEKFINHVIKIKPHQVTLVPDPPEAITSSSGWNCFENKKLLQETVRHFQDNNIRVSLFINPSIKYLDHLCDILPERVELYTYEFAENFNRNSEKSIIKYIEVVSFLKKISPTIGINAGHDLNLQNLEFLLKTIPAIKEVSIGHALVCDAFEYGLNQTIQKYLEITMKNFQ